MADVAAVTERLWTECVPLRTRGWIAGSLGLPEAVAGGWVTYLAGLHDLGKGSPVFQFQAPGGADRVWAAGFPGHAPHAEDKAQAPHATVTQATLAEAIAPLAQLPPRLVGRFAEILGGHHGAFPKAGATRHIRCAAVLVGGPLWRQARARLAAELAEALGVALDQPPTRVPDIAASLWLAGLISVADWIGSDPRFFPLACTYTMDAAGEPAGAYMTRSRASAARALAELGWSAWRAPATVRAFADLFPHLPEPRPLQVAGNAIAQAFAAPEPWLAIVEAPMGEGKTELALQLVDRWRAEGLAGGYVALPTQATSNQMFGRVREFLRRVYPDDVVNLHLLHGHADLSSELQDLRREGQLLLKPEHVDEDEPSGSPSPAGVIAAEWFTKKKHGLLAEYGVGTVDQLLLSVLQTRHGFVRLFGLAGKTVVVDEVHAYDAYMSTLLERVLEWLAALGSAVLLLSATLPAARRDRLIAAYARGRVARETANDGSASSSPAAEPAGYPRLTLSDGAIVRAIPVIASADVRKDVAIRWVSFEPPALGMAGSFRVGEELLAELVDGGCAVVICNTVARAQRTYAALRRSLATREPGWCELGLLHARFPFNERAKREGRALEAFGKPGVGQRPHRAILVSTQIVEQSLDLDFDLMVTELPPIDLLLQRLGRLHRHRVRDAHRPPGLKRPTVWIGGPTLVDGAPTFERGNELVYGAHPLLRTWLTLQTPEGRDRIQIPEEIEPLVEAVYDDRPCPDDVPAPVAERWQVSRAELEGELEEEQEEAQRRWLREPTAEETLLCNLMPRPLYEDAPEFHPAHQALTRLTELTVRVVLLWRRADGHLAFEPGGPVAPAPERHTPTVREAGEFLQRSLGLSDRRIVYSLIKRDVPRGWRDSALLRDHRLVVLDADGSEVPGESIRKWQLRLDAELGVVVEPAS